MLVVHKLVAVHKPVVHNLAPVQVPVCMA